MAVKLNVKVFNQIHQVLSGSMFNANEFKDISVITGYLRMVKADEAADWIDSHNIEYLQGLLEGFEIDNSFKQALRDIHDRG